MALEERVRAMLLTGEFSSVALACKLYYEIEGEEKLIALLRPMRGFKAGGNDKIDDLLILTENYSIASINTGFTIGSRYLAWSYNKEYFFDLTGEKKEEYDRRRKNP